VCDTVDGCQLAWSDRLNGPVLGCWEGTVKAFPDSSEAAIVTWNESTAEVKTVARVDEGGLGMEARDEHTDDPIRGLIVSSDGTVVACNDFKLHFLSYDLSKAVASIQAKEKDTCMNGLTRLSMEQPNKTQNGRG
jgi:hypothetical protein